ncbi:MAG: XerD/XerC family integrase [Candidatus Methanohalarchaeum thermophilum]|uniref:XerD/XerC family integrase n=1 Tax=Methanohalarchaeum thermophilum TaxID=1903181 RepID=A0A1Q6DWL5_METT1|nr:MAG: XerD/XerC family integrase [Candidatus Methanohalarchaeum thermophilum]
MDTIKTQTNQQKTTKNNKEILNEFIRDAKLQGLQKRTLETYKSNLQYYLNYIEKKPWQANKKDLKNFLHHLKNQKQGRRGKGLSPSTINSYFSALNTFYDYLKYEEIIQENPVKEIRQRYIQNKQDKNKRKRQLLSVKQMASLIKATLDTRDRAIITLLAKTGIRRNELINIDLKDINWQKNKIELKPTAKRTNTTVFFDDECARTLKRWTKTRNKQEPKTQALFTNQSQNRLKRHGIYHAVTKHAQKLGHHNPNSNNLEERFTPHCCRHWFTTHLRRNGMRREYIKELRGDTRNQAIDIYDHIDKQKLKRSYMAHIPTLGI